MNTTTSERLYHDDLVFEIVDYIPVGYQIWNIGNHMKDGYLPICQLADRQPFPGGRSINPNTLKAIKCEAAQKILNLSICGVETVKEAEAYLKRHKNAKKGTYEYRNLIRIKEVLPYMKQIKGL